MLLGVFRSLHLRFISESWLYFFSLQMKSYFASYEEFFLENLPKLHSHFEKANLTPDLYIIDW